MVLVEWGKLSAYRDNYTRKWIFIQEHISNLFNYKKEFLNSTPTILNELGY
jgi:hypothetical protein